MEQEKIDEINAKFAIAAAEEQRRQSVDEIGKSLWRAGLPIDVIIKIMKQIINALGLADDLFARLEAWAQQSASPLDDMLVRWLRKMWDEL